MKIPCRAVRPVPPSTLIRDYRMERQRETAGEGTALARSLRAAEVVLGLAALGFVAYLFYGLLGPRPPASAGRGTEAVGRAAPAPPYVLSLADSQVVDLHAGEHFDTTFVVSDPRRVRRTCRRGGLKPD